MAFITVAMLTIILSMQMRYKPRDIAFRARRIGDVKERYGWIFYLYRNYPAAQIKSTSSCEKRVNK